MIARRIVTLVPLAVMLAGCANTTSTADSKAEWLVDDRARGVDWFCEPAEDGGWDCVRDPARLANPRPVRLPKPLFANPAAVIPPVPGPTPASPVEPPPRDPSALPLYQALSFQPERPTALADLPGTFFVIQVIALSTREDLEQYIADNDLPVMSGAVVERDGELFYALLAGIYADRETAERATRSLPEKLSAHGPWIRSMESLQAAMARAEQLAEEF
ncbi:MAG: SPOR domain-containing protein [Gammaproteobacteria bacterium]|nr:SPOR domain-containing protein [Gammaproteobacteria bacterium]